MSDIEKVKEACINSGQKNPDHIEHILEMLQIGSVISKELGYNNSDE